MELLKSRSRRSDEAPPADERSEAVLPPTLQMCVSSLLSLPPSLLSAAGEHLVSAPDEHTLLRLPPARSRSDVVRRGTSAAAPNLKDGIPRRFESDENWGELHRMTWGFDSSSPTPARLCFRGIPGGPGAAGHSFLPSYIIVRGIW